jgi:3-isopropylmalate/(R)-2-methylmalate dehydratase large subunit
MAKTLFEKLWAAHAITELEDGASLIYIDRIFLHERTGSVALDSLDNDGRTVRCPEHVFCTMDHIVDTFPGRGDKTLMPGGEVFITSTRQSTRQAGITLFDIGDPRQGIVHVVSPEQGIALPGCTLVCPDSHTCTLGALGALAWGIGSSDAEHAMATKTLRVQKPKTMRINISGDLSQQVTAKDMILHVISTFTAAGGSGYAVEFAGEAVDSLDIEARMTLCNMAVEFSAFTALIAPDAKTFDYVKGRPYAPSGAKWELALRYWQGLHSDDGAQFDKELNIGGDDIRPMVTWGTSPEQAIAIDGRVPNPATADDAHRKHSMERALHYMGLAAGQKIDEIPIDAAFIGSCTNSRLSDLRAAATVLKGRRIANGVAAVCVPGSTQVKAAAEAEGLDRIFTDAGFEWRESGCSMCFYAGGETFGTGKRVITSTNRNFEGRQGPNTRSHLASPATIAASACTGFITGPFA